MDFAVWKWIPHTKFLSGQTFRSSSCLSQVHLCLQIAVYKNKYISCSLGPLESNQLLLLKYSQDFWLLLLLLNAILSTMAQSFCLTFRFLTSNRAQPTWGNHTFPGNSASAWIKLCWGWLSFFARLHSIFLSLPVTPGMIRTAQQVRHLPNESTRQWRNFSWTIFTPMENITSTQVGRRNLSWVEKKKSMEISQKESWSLCGNCYPTKKEAEKTEW